MELHEGGELFDRIVARGHYTERVVVGVTNTIVEVIHVRIDLLLIYGGLGVCVDLKGSSPLTHSRMDDFVLSRGVIDAAERKCVKCEAKCAEIGYEKGAIVLLKRIRKFSVTQDIGA
ncbi:hypothetical protein Tco_0232404 [Tanacetum coccineum]